MNTLISLPRRLVWAAAALLLAAPATLAAQAPSASLYDELAAADSTLFTAVFVECDAAKANAMFTQDAEFYHDLTGLKAGQELRDQFQSMARSCPRTQGVRRVLEPGSVRVYPMNNYGAVQSGVHRFVNAAGGAPTVAQFFHVWKRVDGGWKLARVISYDHHEERPSAGGTRDE